MKNAFHLTDLWTWKCARCDWEARSEFTVNPQQVVAEAIIRVHLQQHEQEAALAAAASAPPHQQPTTTRRILRARTRRMASGIFVPRRPVGWSQLIAIEGHGTLMQKIPTMFVRDETKPGHPVTDECKSECLWVFKGEGLATVKMDGTNVKIENGGLLKRQKPKDRDYDEASYVPCDRANQADRWAFEAFDAGHEGNGIYELVGPKVQGNPQEHVSHALIRVVPPVDRLMVCMNELRAYGITFEGLKRWLTAHPVEGLVFHHPDGRMAKIKRRDFGLRWPVGERNNDPTQRAGTTNAVASSVGDARS